ncbi:unnamed protein product [Sphagnum jensenii]|uniref:ribose-5-phosphate isomerase n=1 Tax=Sphagnum jensenii TaxID=128206 RepID=A0ABP1BGN5_9BRYO
MASAHQTLSFSSTVPPVTPLLLPQARSPHFRANNSVSSHASVSGNRSRICQRSSCKPHCPFSSFLRREGEESRGGTRRISTSSSPGGKLRTTISRPLCVQASLKPQLEEAAKQVVDYFVRSGMAVGLGTGLASSMAIRYMGEKLKDGSLREIVGVPMTSMSAVEAAKAGVPLATFQDYSQLDFAFDDADAVQEGTLFAIVGRKGVAGRESILKEKAIAKAAKQMVFIIEESKFVGQLKDAVPVLIEQEDWLDVAEEIDDLFLGDAEVWRRPSHGEAGPMGGDFPLVTAEGHFVLDVIFTTPIANAVEVAQSLEAISGVVTHGLVLDTAYAAAVASSTGVKIRTSLFKSAFTSME